MVVYSHTQKITFLNRCLGVAHSLQSFVLFDEKRPRVAIFWPKKIAKRPKNFKTFLNGLKIILEQKEKLFWKALCPNKLIGY